jgi:hypothetical protein
MNVNLIRNLKNSLRGNFRKTLLIEVEEFLKQLDDFENINNKWNEFYEQYFNFYQQAHDNFYSNKIFYLKDDIQDHDEYKVLQKISYIIPDLTFKYDFYEINSLLNNLPEKCNEILSAQLFSSPICSCGFTIKSELPEIKIDFSEILKQGIKNFLMQINLPENREKIETFLLGDIELKEDISKILYIDNVSNINISLILPYLNEKVLNVISKALKGKWKVKHLHIKDAIKEIEGKRLKYNELEKFFKNLIGNDEETIFWITESEEDFNKLKANLENLFMEKLLIKFSEKLLRKLFLKKN